MGEWWIQVGYGVGLLLWLWSGWMNWRAYKRWERHAEEYYQKVLALSRRQGWQRDEVEREPWGGDSQPL